MPYAHRFLTIRTHFFTKTGVLESRLGTMSTMIRTVAIIIALIAPVIDGSIVKTHSCVVSGSDVDVNFEDDDAMQGDWIGLLPLSRVGSQVPDTRADNWVWTCGSQSCGSLPGIGSITISSPNLSSATEWVAFLARFDGGSAPYEVVATSATFRVDTSCSAPVSAKGNINSIMRPLTPWEIMVQGYSAPPTPNPC